MFEKMRLIDSLFVYFDLCGSHTVEVFEAILAAVDIVGCAKQKYIAAKGKEYRRYFVEPVPYGKYVDTALSPTYQYIVYDAVRIGLQVTTAVVECENAVCKVVDTR